MEKSKQNNTKNDFLLEYSENINEKKTCEHNGTETNTRNNLHQTQSTWRRKPFFFKEKYINESNAFTKYYEAIKANGFILDIVADVENMGEYCELFGKVSKNIFTELINIYCAPISKEEKNKSILYASRELELMDTPDKGRCLVTNTSIPKHTVLINESPTVLQVNPMCCCTGDTESSIYRCHNCGNACKVFYTCDGCNVCTFCSRLCQINAYRNYHRYECYGLQRHFWSVDDTDYSYLSFRMMLYGAAKQFETDLVVNSGYGSCENNYPFIYQLDTNFSMLSLAKINQILHSAAKNLIYLISKTNFFHQFKDKNCKLHDLYLYVGGLMVKHYCQAQTNNILLKYPNVSAGFGLNIISGSGKAICPTIALLNHSCTPNAAIVIYDNSIIVKSLKPLKKGEEITICYSEVNVYLTVSDRQIITEELFYFTCTCMLCEYERTVQQAPYKCPLCKNGKAKILNQNYGICLSCRQQFLLDKFIENMKIIKICRNLLDYATYSLNHLTRIAECYSNVFPMDSWHLLDVYRLLYDKHALWGEKPMEVIKYGLLSFNILEQFISRLHLRILVTKVKFVISVLSLKKFLEIKFVTEEEFESMRIFVAETVKIKTDLLFYLSEPRIDFYKEILLKVQKVFESVIVDSKSARAKSMTL